MAETLLPAARIRDRSAIAWTGIGAILLLALAWRLIGIQNTHAWRDEAVTLLHLHDTWWQLIARLPLIEDSPPLFFLVLKAWSVFFTSEWTMRLPAVVFGVAAVAVLMAVAQRVRPGSWWAVGLLAALSPVPIHYSQEVRVYALLALLVALCFWTTELIIRDPRSRGAHLLWGLFAVLAAHGHALGVFIFPMTGAYLLVRSWPRWQAVFSPWSIVTWLIGCAPMFWFNLYWASVHKETGWWIDPLTPNTPMDLIYNLSGAVYLIQALLRSPYPRLSDMADGIGYFILGLSALLIVVALCRRQSRQAAIAFLAATATFTLLMVATSLTGVPNMIERTMLPVLTPLLLLVGLGAAPGASRWPGAWVLAGLSVLMAALLGWGWVSIATMPQSQHERRFAHAECFQWIASQLGPDDMLVITPSWLEDSAAYYLTNAAGEQFFTTGAPVYAGRPPRHTLAHHRITVTGKEIEEGPWSQRIREAIARRQGRDYSVWLISGYWQDSLFRDPVVGQLRSFFKTGFKRVAKYTPPKMTGITASHYVPSAFASKYATSAPVEDEEN